jgi:hypothetical protein
VTILSILQSCPKVGADEGRDDRKIIDRKIFLSVIFLSNLGWSPKATRLRRGSAAPVGWFTRRVTTPEADFSPGAQEGRTQTPEKK